jgi:hypothetical protein
MRKITTLVLFISFVSVQIASSQTQPKEVYRTLKGEKYHKKECKTIKEKKAFKITLKEAKKKGLQACHVCKPHEKKEKKPIKKESSKEKRKVAVRCMGITLKGVQCKRNTKNANGFCWQHSKKE